MLKTNKTTKVVGEFMVGERKVKETVIEIDELGVSTSYSTIYDAELYKKNRKEMRKDERALTEKRYAIEEKINTELDGEDEEEPQEEEPSKKGKKKEEEEVATA